MFGTLVDYWAFTGDSTYNDITLQAMVHQAGDHKNFMPRNQTQSLGNDDQGFWALSSEVVVVVEEEEAFMRCALRSAHRYMSSEVATWVAQGRARWARA